ncbi:S-layer homology domain-containing protein [Natranaerobius trueperi]|uniref:SLH domain-containing protein n=1 Tax=Natranaerobius trueperi TaxID=759412 RepID=A0A226BXU6_9FIRM|nr:S-layer homology domain-containing protein [Natranaerobius trueperi]OWZ83154.1 hypothetical protein CDO51_09995 [Natranaerobius trueperi]
MIFNRNGELTLKNLVSLAVCLMLLFSPVTSEAYEEEVVEKDQGEVTDEKETDKSYELYGKRAEIDEDIRSQLDLASEYRLDELEEHHREENKLNYTYILEDDRLKVLYDKKEDVITSVDRNISMDKPKLSQITADEAKETALEYVENLYLELLEKEKLDTDPLVDRELDDSHRRASDYKFTFMRIHDSIPVQGEGVTVEINSVTGELSRIDKKLSEYDKFISLKEDVSKDEAKEKLIEGLPLQKVYMQALDHTEFQEPGLYYTFLGQLGVEQTGMTRSNYFVDANTKDLLNRGFEKIDKDKLEKTLAEDGSLTEDFLSQEGVTIEASEKPDEITEDDAKEIAEVFVKNLGFKNFEIEGVSETQGVRRSPLGTDDDRLMYEVNFNHEDIDEFRQLQLQICQKQGDIHFYELHHSVIAQIIDDLVEEQPEEINIEKTAKRTLDKMSFASDAMLINSQDLNVGDEKSHLKIENPEDYSPGSVARGFEYSKVVNNIPVETTGYNFRIDMATGLTSSINHIPLKEDDLPDPKETEITLEEAREKLVSNLDIELVYIPHRVETEKELMELKEEPTVEMRPVFKLKPYAHTPSYQEGAPYVNSESGEIYNYEGTSFVDKKIFDLVDDKHWASSYLELALAQDFLPLRQGELLPDEEITKEEVSVLLKQMVYMGERSPEIEKEPYFNNIDKKHPYFEEIQLMTKKGIFDKEKESFPLDKTINREQMAELIIKSLDLDILIEDDLKFPLNFEDVDEISPERKNYVGLVAWLDIMNGDEDRFLPKDDLSRAEAVTVLYRIDEIEV